ncbi:MAG: heavy metal sensor histidine kinase [Holophaga sp.]|nr:heavy metal sensor histidine kinase [Holophaga sp.]
MISFPRTLRFRLTVWYSFALTLVLAAFGLLVYQTMSHRLLQHHDEPLREMGTAVVHILNEHEDCHDLTPDQVRTLDQLGRLVLVHDVEGEHQVFYQSPEMKANALAPAVGALGWEALPTPRFVTIQQNGMPWRVLSLPYRSKAGRPGVVRLMQDLGDIAETLRSLRLALLLISPAGVLLSALGGYWLSGRALAPVDHVARMAHEIEATNLNQRLPHPGVDDEIGRLVDTLNRMIGRLEHSFDAMKQFTADASHELRSPLNTMRSTIDVLLDQPRTVEEHRKGLESLGEEVNRLHRIVEDLLLLARADAGRQAMAREPVELDALVSALAESMAVRAEERGVTLKADQISPAAVLGDEPWLIQLVGNLLDNALKFTPSGGTVEVRLECAESSVRLEVLDSGPGIPEGDLERIFERFYQSDPSRTRGLKSGAGLGLAIAAWIAEAHEGQIQAFNRANGGAAFLVELPVLRMTVGDRLPEGPLV